jgi:hypothetical protein
MEYCMVSTIMTRKPPRRILMNDEAPTPEEIEQVVEAGGPWITLTFTSEDKMFEQSRVLSLEQAGAIVRDLAAEIESAKSKYNIPDQPEVNNE